jgi:tetratricopeptide (TPR) repeat protein
MVTAPARLPWRLVLPAMLLACGGGSFAAAEPESKNQPEPRATAEADGQPGQAEFDAAIDAKLSANSLDDYETVLKHCRKAVELGLDEESRKFAEDLFTGTLLDRAVVVSDAVFAGKADGQQWRTLRDMALRDLNEIVTRDPKMGQAHLMIARLEALPEGNRGRAAKAAAQALEFLGEDRLKQARAHLVLGSIADDSQERDEHFDKAVELAPRDVEARRTRGVSRLLDNKFEEAREDLQVAVEQDPDDVALLERLGVACLMSDRHDEARKAFDKAIELGPDRVGPLVYRARLLAVTGSEKEALADLDRALKIDRGNAAAMSLRARIHMQAGNSEQALADVEGLLAEDADNEDALEVRALLAYEREDYSAAIIDLRRLVARHSDDASLINQLALVYLAAKRPREAIKRFSRSIEIDADNFSSRRGRSDAAISIGDHKAAIADLEKALALKPDDTGALNNLAWLLATSPDDELRNGGRAVELAKKACELTDWKQPHIISTLAAGFAETGDFATARKHSKQAVDAAAEDDTVRKQLQSELASYEDQKAWRERQEMPEESDPKPGADVVPEETEAAGRKRPPAREAGTPRQPRRPFDEE